MKVVRDYTIHSSSSVSLLLSICHGGGLEEAMKKQWMFTGDFPITYCSSKTIPMSSDTVLWARCWLKEQMRCPKRLSGQTLELLVWLYSMKRGPVEMRLMSIHLLLATPVAYCQSVPVQRHTSPLSHTKDLSETR